MLTFLYWLLVLTACFIWFCVIWDLYTKINC